MRKYKGLKISLVLILGVLLALSSCAQADGGETDTEGETEAVFTPAKDNGESSELGKRYNEYVENMSLAFKGYEPANADAFEYLISDGKVKITKYVGESSIIVVPEMIEGATVTEIAESAFSGGNVGAVYIPDSVTYIAQGAFEDCGGLSTLRLPMVGDGVENAYLGFIFGADAPDKNSVSVPASLDMVIIGAGCETIEKEAFRGIKSISAVIFEGEIAAVGKMAFYQCSDLVMVTLDKVNGGIDELAFAFCSSLYYIDISNADAANRAFYLCTDINGVKLNLAEGDFLGKLFGAESPDFNDEFVPTSLRSIIVGDKTEKIPDRAFTSCKYLTEITFSETVNTIGVRALYACRSLSEIILPDSLKTIDDDAFFGCDHLKTVEFGSGLESIGMQAFYGCVSLEKANVGENTALGKNAFGNCPSLNIENENVE